MLDFTVKRRRVRKWLESAASDVGIHLIVRNSQSARALDILFENFERGSLPQTFKFRNSFSRREQPQRVRRSASRRTGGRPAAGAVRCSPLLLRQWPYQREAQRANEAARKRRALTD